MKIGFGLDLGGYSSKGNTILAAVEAKGHKAEVTILAGSAFAANLKGNSDLDAQVECERVELLKLISLGSVAVDVPIDLQELPAPPDVQRVWELTQRPVDRAFSGLAPLADKLGYCVARFSRLLKSDKKFKVGHSIFETYPAASLSVCCLQSKGYKAGPESEKARSKIAASLGIFDSSLTHDELDAIICALASVAEGDDILDTTNLRNEMLSRLGKEASPNRHRTPEGYRLLRGSPFRGVHVRRSKMTEWLDGYSR